MRDGLKPLDCSAHDLGKKVQRERKKKRERRREKNREKRREKEEERRKKRERRKEKKQREGKRERERLVLSHTRDAFTHSTYSLLCVFVASVLV